MTLYLIAAYVVLSLAVGLLGRGSRAGISGTFLLSLLFTPLIVWLFVSAFRPRIFTRRPPGS